jgi:catechol 2,3-dioxygenase-like lactoylglutathione lyase family enzyme
MSFSTPQRLAVVSLWADDPGAAAHFYRNILGLRLMTHDPYHSGRPHFDVGGTYLTILKGRPISAQDAEPPHFPLVAFEVDDLDFFIERLQAHHVELPWSVEEGMESRWIKLRDPAGNLIEIVQFKEHK